MATFNYQVITGVKVEVTMEQLKKDFPEIVKRLAEKGYQESFEDEDEFEDTIDIMVEEDEQLNDLIFNQGTSPQSPYIVYQETDLDTSDTYGDMGLIS